MHIFNQMWFTNDDDEEGMMSSTYRPEFLIIREKINPADLLYFLADYDENAINNTLMWCRNKDSAHTFTKYEQAEHIVRWLETLKIKAKVESI